MVVSTLSAMVSAVSDPCGFGAFKTGSRFLGVQSIDAYRNAGGSGLYLGAGAGGTSPASVGLPVSLAPIEGAAFRGGGDVTMPNA